MALFTRDANRQYVNKMMIGTNHYGTLETTGISMKYFLSIRFPILLARCGSTTPAPPSHGSSWNHFIDGVSGVHSGGDALQWPSHQREVPLSVSSGAVAISPWWTDASPAKENVCCCHYRHLTSDICWFHTRKLSTDFRYNNRIERLCEFLALPLRNNIISGGRPPRLYWFIYSQDKNIRH